MPEVYISCIQYPEGYPGTGPEQKAVKLGPVEPEAALEAAVRQVQLLVKVLEFPKLHPSEGTGGASHGSVWISECFELSTAGTKQRLSQCSQAQPSPSLPAKCCVF